MMLAEKILWSNDDFKHKNREFLFYTLYGHLSFKTFEVYKKGDKIKKGKLAGLVIRTKMVIGFHIFIFQILLSLLNYKNNFPGVVYHNDLKSWKSICPNPDSIFSKNLKSSSN